MAVCAIRTGTHADRPDDGDAPGGLNLFALAAVLTVTTLVATCAVADLARRLPGPRNIL